MDHPETIPDASQEGSAPKLGAICHEPVEVEIERWARALCAAYGADPDTIIGNPEAPRWRSWVSYAVLSRNAARLLPDGSPLATTNGDSGTTNNPSESQPQ